MNRGEIWTVAGGGAYSGKPPVVILHNESYRDYDSLVVCPFTTDPTSGGLLRIPVEPSITNGLRVHCTLMVDKLSAVPRSRLGRRVGVLEPAILQRLSRTAVSLLGLA